MAVRDVVHIDEDLCDGCGDCVPSCAEGAIQIVDGKARLVGDVYCDGLGACLGHCPQGAITVVRREAEDFDEEAVKQRLAEVSGAAQPAPAAGLPIAGHQAATGCPGSRTLAWRGDAVESDPGPDIGSRLRQWPIQLHLVPPTAPFFTDAQVLLAADCVAYAVGGFHRRYLDGKALAIACPKLDSHQEIYIDKLAAMIEHGGIRGLEVVVMEVPCCSGLVRLVQEAVARSSRRVPVTVSVVGVRGVPIATRAL
jgi:Pyruvate/2-oxoacid:ferredoxin oxidoreductase delta subunit